MGPFMVEIVFCRVTRRGRKKRKGMNKIGRENMRNDGPMQSFIPKDDMLKVTLDLSDNGPVFSALDDMMLKLSLEGAEEGKKKGKGGAEAKNALKNLLRSGIPGIEGMFGGETPAPRFGKAGGKKGFHKMNDGSKKKFMTAIFGEDGTQVDTSTAAALLAATCSQGNPDIGNKLAELLVPNMGETVDPAMMAGLMSACSLINAGSGTEEVMKAMQAELAASGLTEEEILEKTQLLMKSFGKEDTASTAEYKLLSKQKNNALKKAEISPKDFTTIMLAHKAIAACGTTPENVAKVFMIESVLSKKGANPEHTAKAMLNLGQISDEVKEDCKQKILAAWSDCSKIGKTDVGAPVRMHLALDNENEPGWVEVKNIKDTVGGVSPNSQEAIELNLARATKSGGLKKEDIGRANIALKAVSMLGVDPVQLAKILFLEKTICSNGVPAMEVGRVLADGLMPAESTQGIIKDIEDKLLTDIKGSDVDLTVKLYNQLKFKSNILEDVIEYVDKTLIQVRCSLEDVADNMISTLRARGEKENKIIYDVTDTLKKTGASANVVSTTIMPPLKDLTGKKETELTKVIGRNLKEVNYKSDEVKGAVTEMVLRILEEDPQLHGEACAALESVFKDLGDFPNTIKEYIAAELPPPPTPPEEIERRRQIAEELARLEREEAERERLKNMPKPADDDDDYDMDKPRNKKLDAVMNGDGSRRGSMVPPAPRSRQGSITIGGLERRGSYYDDGVTQRATVAVVTDDPEHKKNLKNQLSGVFDGSANANANANANFNSNANGGAGVNGNFNANANASRLDGGSAAGLANGVDAGLDGILSNLGPNPTPEQLANALQAAGIDNKRLGEGMLHSIGGFTKFRRPEDMKDVALEAVGAVDAALMAHQNRTPLDVPQLSDESRALMQQILSSNSSQDEISSRVAALLAGTALSTSRGGEKAVNLYGEVKMEQYDINTDLSSRRRKDNFEMPDIDIPNIQIPGADAGSYDSSSRSAAGVRLRERNSGMLDSVARAKRGSIKRQSEILRESRKRAEEREEERQRKQSYYRRVAGLRKAKVPLMVYSCGGFSRCFRIARFYDAEGPPVGVVYERPEEDRRSLNPDL